MDSAGIPWYSTGTVNVTQGSTNITGVGTNWVNAGLKKGDIFTLDKSRLYQVWTVNSNTSITLQEAYQGATGTAQVYFVIRNFAATMQAEIAAQVAELVNKYESYIDTELKQITGPAGPTSFPYRGTWATGRSYNGLDIVQYGNQLYMALYGHTSTTANAPGTTATAWKQLTFDAAFSATQAEIAAVANAGAKNLLRLTGQTTQTVAGVTFTINGNGTVTVNGTATADAYFFAVPNTKEDNWNFGSAYILSGCPNGGSESTYYLAYRVGRDTDDLAVRIDKDYGSGMVLGGFDASTQHVRIMIAIKSGQTVNNLVFRPMIRHAAIEDDTYVPYGMSNAELTEKVLALMAKVGA